MVLKIHHKTTYSYAAPVYLEPHHFYFYPAHRNYLQLRSFQLSVSPEPEGLAFRLDAENNPYHQCWFSSKVQILELDVKITIETFPINPFNFLLEEDPKLDHQTALKPFLDKEPLSEPLLKWVSDLHDLSGDNLVTFITFLAKEIHADWEHVNRYFPTTIINANDCFESRTGSCRDLAWLLIQMLRNQEIPARFVSGYSFNPELDEGHELHAWVEAWLPGAGWVGLDPSSGLLATDQYIPVSTSHLPENTLPVQGNYRGNSHSRLDFDVKIHQT